MKLKLTWLLTLFMAFVMQFSFAQEKTVTGTVTTAEDGLPLPGASVIVKGTVRGSQTDFDGKYSIKVNSGDVLVVSYVGMKDTEVIIGSDSVYDVALKVDNALDEVVVLGYASRGINQITGNVVQVGAEEINDIPLVSVDQALQGKVAGLVISSGSGTPGSIQDIRIRGVGSINISNDPLFVIDGVPVVNANFSGSGNTSSLSALAAINNEDVESISVLKDASATAAYGARGSNGVIVITTKKGKSGETTFNFSSAIGLQDFAVGQPEALSGAQREQLLYQGMVNSFAGINTLEEAAEAAPGTYGGNWTPYANWIEAGRPEGDWQNVLLNDSPLITNYNLSASGGDDRSNFYASVGYNSTEAIVIGGEFERITGVLNYNRDLTDKLKFKANFNVSNSNQNGILERGAFFANPFLTRLFMPNVEQPFTPDGDVNIDLTTNIFNTLHLVQNDVIENDLTRAIANTSLEYEIIPRLKFKTLFSIDYNINAYLSYQNREHGGSVDTGGSTQQSTERNFNWVTQNSLNYNFSVGEHSFDFTALQEYQKNKNNYLVGSGQGFPADGLIYLDNVSANFQVGGNFTDWAQASYLGLFNYNYAGKYILDLTVRREGSSRFAPGSRFGTFWSAGAAWNIHQESFLEDVSWINTLRLRGSYGITGNSGIGINSYQALLGFSADYDAQGAAFPTGFGNPLLTWEKNATYDVGVDYTLFDGRVSGSVAYFNRRTFDLLQAVPLSRTTGFSEVDSNAGEIVNKGLELDLNVDIFRTKDFNWSVSANYATLDNEVTQLALDGNGEEINVTTGTRRIETGQPLRAWYMRGWAGVNPANGDPLWYINGVDGEVTNNYNEAEVAFQGENAIPQWSGGFGTRIDYKGFFVNADFFFQGGNKIFEDWSRFLKSNGLRSTLQFNGTTELLNSWTTPGQVTDYPAIQGNSAQGTLGGEVSSRFLYEGDFLRLRNLSFGYNFPKSMIDGFGLDALSLSIRGTNVLTWVKDDRLKYDPEVRADGFTRLVAPPVKSWLFGVNVTF